MSRQPRLEFAGALYHVTARGIEKKAIFLDDRDHDRFLNLLALRVPRFEVKVFAYCLMSNHLHLALQTGAAPLQRFMKSLQTAYAQSFNRRYERIGPLFAGRYKAFLVDNDRYFKALIRYIVANPVEGGIVDRPGEYRWSSYRAYFARTPDWLDADGVLRRFGRTRAEAKRRLQVLLDPAASLEGTYEALPRHVQAIVGEEEFTARALERKADEDLIRRDLTIERVAAAVARELSIPEAHLGDRQAGESTRARALAGLLARDVASIPLARTARFFARHRTAISKQVALLEARIRDDKLISDQVHRIRNRLAPRQRRPARSSETSPG